MEIKDLQINQVIEINGYEYRYKGINKIRKPNFGAVQMIVFEPKNSDFEEKHYDLKLLSRDLKIHQNGKIELR